MKWYKKLNVLLIISIVLTLFSGCNSNSASTVSSSANKKESLPKNISISYVKSPLNVPSIVEKRQKLFEKEFSKDNINITYPEITEGSKMTEAVAAGSLDFCNAIGATSVILGAANGVDIKIIGVYSRAPKAFTIMAKDPSIKTISDLKGKKVVGPKGTVLHQLLLAALNKDKLSESNVQFINMGIPDGVSALLSGKADAALVAGAAVDNAKKNGAHVITTGQGLLDGTIVIGVSGKFLKEHPDVVKRYLSVHNKSLSYMKNNSDETFKITAEEEKLSVSEVKEMYKLYDFNPKITSKDIEDLKKTEDFLKKNGMMSKSVSINSLIAK
ncbi:MAG: NrtA/SsuA/CpmA family ABC transporter substrate-binding protein [Clostridium sp.]|nr:NrtA/SsuA/CpmA family ABC transporter substrate-binding protein [Clostridium sp.]